MTVFSSVRETLKEQMTPNLAFGLSALLILGLFYGWSTLRSQRVEAELRLDDARHDLAAVSDVSDSTLWDQRADDARQAKINWEARAWTGETPGIVSAEAQARINQMLLGTGLQSVQVSVSSDPTEVDGNMLLRFDASGVGDSRALINMIVEICALNKSVRLTELTAPVRAQGSTRIVLGGFLPYSQPENTESNPN